jgi:hypothetical protein
MESAATEACSNDVDSTGPALHVHGRSAPPVMVLTNIVSATKISNITGKVDRKRDRPSLIRTDFYQQAWRKSII